AGRTNCCLANGAPTRFGAQMGMARTSLYRGHMRKSLRGSVLVLPLALMSFACGGSAFTTDSDAGNGGTSSSGSSGSSSSGSSSGSGGSGSGGSGSGGSGSGSSSGGSADGGAGSPCPLQAGGGKNICAPQGLECEYGSNPVEGCDSVATCQGSWQVKVPTDSNCSVSLGSACPSTFDGVPEGSACPNDGLICNYPRGR